MSYAEEFEKLERIQTFKAEKRNLKYSKASIWNYKRYKISILEQKTELIYRKTIYNPHRTFTQIFRLLTVNEPLNKNVFCWKFVPNRSLLYVSKSMSRSKDNNDRESEPKDSFCAEKDCSVDFENISSLV